MPQNNKEQNKKETTNKKRKKNKAIITTLIAVVVLLSITSAVSIVYNFLGGFYYCRVVSFSHLLGEEQTINVGGVGAFNASCAFSGSLVVGADIKQPLTVEVESFNNPLYLRAKYNINGINENPGYMFGFVNWVLAKDGYLYFNQPVTTNQKIGLCNTLKINVQMELKSSTNYIMVFTVEASESAWQYEAV